MLGRLKRLEAVANAHNPCQLEAAPRPFEAMNECGRPCGVRARPQTAARYAAGKHKGLHAPEPGALLRHIGDGAVQVSPAKKEVDARRLLALSMVSVLSDWWRLQEEHGRLWKNKCTRIRKRMGDVYGWP